MFEYCDGGGLYDKPNQSKREETTCSRSRRGNIIRFNSALFNTPELHILHNLNIIGFSSMFPQYTKTLKCSFREQQIRNFIPMNACAPSLAFRYEQDQYQATEKISRQVRKEFAENYTYYHYQKLSNLHNLSINKCNDPLTSVQTFRNNRVVVLQLHFPPFQELACLRVQLLHMRTFILIFHNRYTAKWLLDTKKEVIRTRNFRSEKSFTK